MADLFYTILNMSITGSYVIIFVIIARLFLKKLPKKYSYALWAAAGFRLCCPVSFQSVFSIFSLKPFDMSKAQNSNAQTLQYIDSSFAEQNYPQLTTGIPSANTVIYEEVTTGARFIDFKNNFMHLLPYIWLAVLCILLIYAVFSYIKLNLQMKNAVLLKENIYQSDKASSPFISGIIKPKIYIPFGLDESTEKYVLAHERYHIKRLDHIVKPITFLILCIHWFNPLCWLAFQLMNRDMEMSCDEKVLSESNGIKKEYSSALLSFAAGFHFPSGSPLSFCESGAKKRIKNILSYKKPAVWLSITAIILIAAFTIGCAANPKAPKIIESKLSVSENASYTAGRVIWQSPVLSSIIKDGSQYADINITENSIKITDKNGNKIFESTNASTKEFSRNEFNNYFADMPLNGIDISKEIPASCNKLTEYIYTAENSGLHGFAVYKYNNSPAFIAEINEFISNDKNIPIAITIIYELLPNTSSLENAISNAVLEYHSGKYLEGKYKCETHYTLQTKMGSIEDNNDRTCLTAYIYKNYGEFDIKDNMLDETSGSAGYAAITFNIEENGEFLLKEYWEPRDGGLLQKDLNRVFPNGIVDDFDHYDYNRNNIIQANYKKAIEASGFDTDKAVEKLFADIENNKEIAQSSNPGDYISASPDKYNLLINYGDYTLKYIYKEFLQGNAEGIKDNLMWIVMKELSPDEIIKSVCYSGQEYFNLFYKHAIEMYKQNDEEYMKEFEPKAWLLLEMDYIK